MEQYFLSLIVLVVHLRLVNIQFTVLLHFSGVDFKRWITNWHRNRGMLDLTLL